MVAPHSCFDDDVMRTICSFLTYIGVSKHVLTSYLLLSLPWLPRYFIIPPIILMFSCPTSRDVGPRSSEIITFLLILAFQLIHRSVVLTLALHRLLPFLRGPLEALPLLTTTQLSRWPFSSPGETVPSFFPPPPPRTMPDECASLIAFSAPGIPSVSLRRSCWVFLLIRSPPLFFTSMRDLVRRRVRIDLP